MKRTGRFIALGLAAVLTFTTVGNDVYAAGTDGAYSQTGSGYTVLQSAAADTDGAALQTAADDGNEDIPDGDGSGDEKKNEGENSGGNRSDSGNGDVNNGETSDGENSGSEDESADDEDAAGETDAAEDALTDEEAVDEAAEDTLADEEAESLGSGEMQTEYVEVDHVLQSGGLLPSESEDGEIAALGTVSDSTRSKVIAELDKALGSMAEGLSLNSYGLSIDEFEPIFSGFLNSHPEYFYVASGFSWSYSSNTPNVVAYVFFSYTAEASEVETMTAEYESAVNTFLEGCDPDWCDLEKLLYLNSYMCKNCAYDTTYSRTHRYDAYGCLVEGVCVCQGYALAVNELCGRMGIDSMLVSSEAVNHAWNIVSVGGNYYHLDVTWDDSLTYNSTYTASCDMPGRAMHSYFLKSNDYFKTTGHLADQDETNYDWVVQDGIDPDEASSSKYDSYSAWSSVRTGFVYRNGYWYTMDSDSSDNGWLIRYICSSNDLTLEKSICSVGKWYVPGGSGWYSVYYGGIGLYAGNIYYSSCTQIYGYDPTGSASSGTVIYTLPDDEADTAHIVTMTVKGNILTYFTSSTVNCMDPDDARTIDLSSSGLEASEQYTATFDAAGGYITTKADGEAVSGSSTLSTSKAVVPQNAYGQLPEAARTGYTFAGWYTTAEDTESVTGVKITSSTVFNGKADITLYARWTPETYTVTFSAGDGYITADAAGTRVSGTSTKTCTKTVNYGQTYIQSGEALPEAARTGYTFAGWYTTAEDTESVTGVKITSSTVFNGKADVTLYARWTPETYTVTFKTTNGYISTYADGSAAEGTSVKSCTKTVTYGKTYGTMPAAFRTGYIFEGWYTTSGSDGDTSGTKITSVTEVSTAAAHTLYARWTVSTYKVTFDANGGYISETCTGTDVSGSDTRVTSDSKTVTYGKTYGTLPEAARTGYTFAGWYTTAGSDGDTTGTKITSGTAVSLTEDHTLYARWTVNTYKVTFDANGGYISETCTGTDVSGKASKVTTDSKTVSYEKKYGTLPEAARTGYAFAGWYTTAGNDGDTSGTKITSDTAVSQAEDHTLYARWTAREYTLTFNAGSGYITSDEEGNAVSGTAVKDCTTAAVYGQTYGQICRALPEAARTGYSFLGWYMPDGSTRITGDSVYDTASDLTLTAVYEPLTVKIIFDHNTGSTGDSETESVSFGAVYGELPVPVRDGYEFAGWYSVKPVDDKTPEADAKILAGDTVLDESAISSGASNIEASDSGYTVTVYAYWKTDWGDLNLLTAEEKEQAARELLGDADSTWDDLLISDIPTGLWVIGVPDSVTYNGKAQTFGDEIKVFHGTRLLRAGTDYTVSYKNNTKAYTPGGTEDTAKSDSKSAPQVIITGKGSYTKSVTEYFAIEPLLLQTASGTVSVPDIYLTVSGKTGSEKIQKVVPTVTAVFTDSDGSVRSTVLKNGTDYTLLYEGTDFELSEENQEKKELAEENGSSFVPFAAPGVYEVRIKGTNTGADGKYTGNFTTETGEEPSFRVIISDSSVAQAAKLSVTLKDRVYDPEEAAGTNDAGDFYGILPSVMTVKNGKKELSSVDMFRIMKDSDWKELLAMTPDELSEAFEEGGEYGDRSQAVLLYHISDNTSVGTATVTFLGIPKSDGTGISGTLTKTYKITAPKLTKTMVTGAAASVDLNAPGTAGAVRKTDGSVVFTGLKVTYPSVSGAETGTELSEGTDYTVTYKNNTGIGTASVAVAGKGNYAGSFTLSFKITGTSIGDKKQVTVGAIDAQTYTGTAVVPGELASVLKTVPSEADEESTALRGIEASEYAALVKAAEAGEASAGTDPYTAYDYTYTVANNVNTGTAKVVFTGVNNYGGTASATFRIVARPMTETMTDETSEDAEEYGVLSVGYMEDGTFTEWDAGTENAPVFEYTKNGVKPEVAVRIMLPGAEDGGFTTLTAGKDYTVTYTGYNKYPKAASASVTIKGKGGYKTTAALTRNYTITGRTITNENRDTCGMTFTVSEAVLDSYGRPGLPTVTVKDSNGAALKAGTDYEKITIAGGYITYAGETEVRTVSGKTITLDTVTRNAGDAVQASDSIPEGTQLKVQITFISSNGLYSGTVTVPCRAVLADISKATVTVSRNKEYAGAGSPVTLDPDTDITVTMKVNGQTCSLICAADEEAAAEADPTENITDDGPYPKRMGYVITGYENNSAKGKAKVTIKGVGAFGGTKTVAFNINARNMGGTGFLNWVRSLAGF